MTYQDILNFDENTAKFVPAKTEKKKSVTKKDKERGCEFCPLNKIPGVKKVKNIDRITGKDIMLWAQNPGYEENRKGIELIGGAGEFLWEYAEGVGLKREDCDIQNVVRCGTFEYDKDLETLGKNRPPTKEEIHCCSIYNEEALEKQGGKAKVHLVLGQVAAKSLLRGEYRKDQKTFFSKKLNSWVIVTDHPSYFLRGAPRSRLDGFQEALRATVAKAKGPLGRFAYVESLNTRMIKSADIKAELKDKIEKAAKKGLRIVVDIEDGYDEKGENKVVYIGFCWHSSYSVGILLNHEKLGNTPISKEKLEFMEWFFGNKDIKKVFHHGVYDVWKIRKLLGYRVRGYDFDTEYSEYMTFSGARAFGLAAIADRRFRQFAGYKGILEPYIEEKTGRVNFWKLPLKILRIYNGADCILSKKIELTTNKVNLSLMKVMVYAAPVLARMEVRGPWLDFPHADVLERWIPIKVDSLKAELRKISGRPKFNPNAPKQVQEIVYDQLKLGKHLPEEWFNNKKNKKRSTSEATMLLLMPFHIFPKLQDEFRKMYKKKSTYLEAYKKSALLHKGRIRTKWWLTGTITNRLRSGGEKDKSKGIVNLQNIHGAEEIECLLVSDLNWRKLYKAWKEKRAA